ncbi:MAG TPA: uroporphyrinogen decarboxylase family protein [Dehalococcoidia bacterium]
MSTEVLEKKWSDLTPQEKREQRDQWYLSPPGVAFPSPEAERAYKTNAQRMIDVYNVREPDMVPVSLPMGNLAAGLSQYSLMYEPEKVMELASRLGGRGGAAGMSIGVMATPGRVLELLDYKLYTWPGHGLPKDAPGYQFVEGEYMKADEYDELIRDPSDFWLRTYMPRAFGALQPFTQLQPVTDVTEIVQVVSHFVPYARPDVRAALKALIEVGEELERWMEITGGGRGGGAVARMFCKAPFDTIGDTLRGTKGIILDMHRQPEKLLKALDVVADVTIANTIANLNESKGLMAYFPLHKGADGWMSHKQFMTFYWPSLKKVIDALIEEGILAHLFAEGSYDTRLEYVNEFPKGAVSWLFDRTDMARAKQILGDRCCISGNVPAGLLRAGTPAEVKEYCRKLIEACAPGGGFILACGTAQVDNAPPENLRAMQEAAQEYGVYRK